MDGLELRVSVVMRLRAPGMRVHNSSLFSIMHVGKEVGRCEKEGKHQQHQHTRIFYRFSQSDRKDMKKSRTDEDVVEHRQLDIQIRLVVIIRRELPPERLSDGCGFCQIDNYFIYLMVGSGRYQCSLSDLSETWSNGNSINYFIFQLIAVH